MDNHLYLFIRQLLPCQIVKLSLVKHPFNQITCWECSIPWGNRRLRQQSQIHQNSCIQHFPRPMNEKRKQKLLNMRTHLPKNQPVGPQPCAYLLCGSHWDLHCPPCWCPCACPLRGLSCAEYTALGITQVKGLVTLPWLRGSMASQRQGKIV